MAPYDLVRSFVATNSRGKRVNMLKRMASSSTISAFIDIGANMLDEMFHGIYRDKQLHAPDVLDVLKRAKHAGAEAVIITSGTLEDTRRAVEMCRQVNTRMDSFLPVLRTTIGIHPTNAGLYASKDKSELIKEMVAIAHESSDVIISVGECGLDRLREEQFCPFQLQQEIWRLHFDLASQLDLPMFIHSRECSAETIATLRDNKLSRGGVVHSFDGSLEAALEILSISDDLFIGINGCSLRTDANLDVVRALPLDRILVESDSPWCEIKPTSAASKLLKPVKDRWHQFTPEVNKPEKLKGIEGQATVKNRNEPRNTLDVIRVIAALKGLDESTTASKLRANTHRLFLGLGTIHE